MPVSDLHARVASVALAAAAEHGFALGGGNALLAHGVISRPTQDVDLFTDQEHGVEAAADAVEAALRDAGFQAEREHDSAGLADIFPGMGEGLAEWVITAPDGQQLTVQLAYFDRSHDAVAMEIGPVLDLEDVAGGKVCALASRVEPRDYADTARMLERYSPATLITFARRLDPGLTARDFADAGRQLDQIDDDAFTRYGLTRRDVAAMRAKFAAWPRTPDAAARPDNAEPADPRAGQASPGREPEPGR
jgi:Nucleotidyl transferase AbiEii toxin, Type IV TA system